MSNIIQLLPDAIANQIAAGEVVQRPASVVKEVIENAIDAGATEIQLSLQNAGKTLIQIIDNGGGMSETDARMCFERHATSKIKKIDDLFDIHTFGFRGEAMASIAAVARVELKTRQAQNELGTEIIIEDSRVLQQNPVATKTGTTITVRNLFFNVPARKNFLKSNKVELRHIYDEFTRASITQPQIGFKLIVENELQFDLRPGSFKKRVVQLFGKNYEQNLVEVSESSEIVSITGFVATPEMARKSRGDQYFLANGRFIKSPYFNHAILTAFEGLIAEDSYPAYFLQLQIDPRRIDVNVHPTKTEVKFEDEKSIYAILLSSIRKALNDFHVAPAIDFDEDRSNIDRWMSNNPHSKFQFNPPPVNSGNAGKSTGAAPKTEGWKEPLWSRPQNEPSRQNWQTLYEQSANTQDTSNPTAPVRLLQQESLAGGERKPFQMGNKFLVATIKSGLIIVHQNRAHQRILFERFNRQMQENKSKTQKKLFPEVVQLNSAQYRIMLGQLSTLNQAGFDMGSFGNNALIVNGVPEEISDENSELIIKRLADEFLADENRDSLSLKDNMAKYLAKSAAIKSGKTLNSNEVSALIDQLFACKEPYFALDGHPTLQLISMEELEQKF
ncbi:DNA mismatch repair endonuclease MutL [bacterium]|nr:DNA mismatch repair endonuclease MutL [bacterium]